MMTKIILPGSQDFGVLSAQLIKVSSSGLRGNDFQALIKRAGHEFADALHRVKLASGETPVHLIALGATEFYGPNRNGDGFKEATCRKHHQTFVKHARFYRDHANKDPRKSYGLVKLSVYNEPMHRIELLVALNGTKEAAERNSGLLADQEMEKLAKGDDLGVSMACKVPYDICAGCGNQAKTRADYCTGTDEGGLCKRGGVRNHMTFVHDDGFINHVDNPNPVWFDISKVFRPADRIAYTSGILKAASAAHLGGAQIAEYLGVTPPPELNDNNGEVRGDVLKAAQRLAGLERDIEKMGADKFALSFSPYIQNKTNWNDHGSTATQALDALARNKICLPLDGYAQLTKGASAADYIEASRRYLPGIYGRMLQDGSLAGFDTSKHLPSTSVPAGTKSWAEKHAADYSFSQEFVQRRVLRAAIYHGEMPLLKQPVQTKIAGAAESTARDYALYKLAFLLKSGCDSENDLTAAMVVRQNYL
jgi:hypothetical protein